MRRSLVRRVSVLLAAVIVSVELPHAAEAVIGRPVLRCSKVWGPGIRAPLYFVGTAVTDTLHVGAGDITPTGQEGHSGRGTQRVVYGQIVRVELLGNDVPEELRAALRSMPHPEVVLVPWDYDPACNPTYWSRSARWIEPNSEGFYDLGAQIRPRNVWIDERPIFDVFFTNPVPYPTGVMFRSAVRNDTARRQLTAREYFELHSALPTAAELTGSSQDAADRLNAWETANPELVGRYPANIILSIIKPRLHSDSYADRGDVIRYHAAF